MTNLCQPSKKIAGVNLEIVRVIFFARRQKIVAAISRISQTNLCAWRHKLVSVTAIITAVNLRGGQQRLAVNSAT